jgi:DtxR family Mn-dependent transcriptional regulator
MRRKTVEEYIEAIYLLEKKDDVAHTGQIASELGVRPPTVTEMLRKLKKDGLVKYEAYLGANLTPKGKRMARELMKKHKVIADLLEIIGVKREIAEIDACRIEHHVSQETHERLSKFVQFVQSAPGDPLWIQHFELFCKSGKYTGCEACGK